MRRKTTNCKVFAQVTRRDTSSRYHNIKHSPRKMSAFTMVFSGHVITALVHVAIESPSIWFGIMRWCADDERKISDPVDRLNAMTMRFEVVDVASND